MERFPREKETEREREKSRWYLGWHKEKETLGNLTPVFHHLPSTMSNVQICVTFSCSGTSTKRTERSKGAATVEFFAPFFYLFVSCSISFGRLLHFIYVRLSVHGFQTNDSMFAPEIHVMRTAAWLMRRKDDPAAWRKPEAILTR